MAYREFSVEDKLALADGKMLQGSDPAFSMLCSVTPHWG